MKNKNILRMVAVLIFAMIVLTYNVPYLFAENTETIETKQVVLDVKNMTCPACWYKVKKSLTRLDGVKTAKVSLLSDQAVVTYEPSKISIDDLIKATTDAGYPSSIKKIEEK